MIFDKGQRTRSNSLIVSIIFTVLFLRYTFSGLNIGLGSGYVSPSLGRRTYRHKDPHYNGLSEFRYVVQSTKMLLKYNYKEIRGSSTNRKGIGNLLHVW